MRRRNYDEDETDQTTESPLFQGRTKGIKNMIHATKAAKRPTIWDRLRRRKRK